MTAKRCACTQEFGLHHNPACRLFGIVGESNVIVPGSEIDPWRKDHIPRFGPAQQPWVLEIPIMQQSVLFAAIRAPDGLRKDHPIKVLLRWYRRCVLLSAFDKRALVDPFEPGGGSFTGPFTSDHATAFCDGVGGAFYWRGNFVPENAQEAFDYMRKVYLRHVDELPHHFQLHFMHAAQIVGVHHSDGEIAKWWWDFYLMIVNDAHLHPESAQEMNLRLSDNDAEWRAREEVVAH